MAEQEPFPIPDVYRIVLPETTPYTGEVTFKSEKPELAIVNTAAFLDSYFHGWVPDEMHETGTDILMTHTIHFLYDVQRGNFFASFLKKPICGKSLQRIFEKETGIIISPFMWEAYRRAIIIFNAMPHEMAPSYLLAPPTDEEDFIQRVAEIQDEVYKIIQGKTEPQTPVMQSIPLFRTFAFFKTGEALAA